MTYQTISPTTGKLINTYADISDQALESTLAQAHTVFETEWRDCSVAERAKIVSNASALLRRKKMASQLV